MKKQYITEIIGQDYKSWQKGNIGIKSGTNTGKTTFICNVLIPWCKENNKTVLYLTNRILLNEQIKAKISQFDNVTLWNCQVIESFKKQEIPIPQYDYIVVDECHYFRTDAIFNRNTDYSFEWITKQHDSVIIWMSATAERLYSSLTLNKTYELEDDYSNLDAVYFYGKQQLQDIIDDILESRPDDKILVFVDSIDRLKKMHVIYGDKADYMCSKNNKKAKYIAFIKYDCVKDFTFEKQILFTTKAMDNGIDIKDKRVKHVFSEIFDVESCLQSLGRKRPIDDDDQYNIYIAVQSKKTVNSYLNGITQQVKPVRLYKHDIILFNLEYAHDKQFLQKYHAFYGDVDYSQSTIGQIKVNEVLYRKLEDDLKNCESMQQNGYIYFMRGQLGKQRSSKVKKLKILEKQHDIFAEYLKKITGQKLFKEGQAELKTNFKSMLGLKANHIGIKTLNGQLQDNGYKYVITSGREKSRKSENRDKMYWCVSVV